MTFTTHFSNRIETLAAQLMAGMQDPLRDPLAVDYVLVDNKVMGQWLNLQLAQQQGIAANIRYIQPHELFWLLARAVVSAQIPKETPLSKQEMTWKLYGLFGQDTLLASQMMKPVQHYLQGEDCKALKRYQLAAAVADLFDQYLIYRPQWMLDWEYPETWTRKEDDGFNWQRELWLKLTQSAVDPLTPGLHHRAIIENHLLAALNEGEHAILQQKIPLQRLFVFGITSMPPKLLEMLLLLGQHIAVDLFALNPCSEYWFDIQSAKTLAKKEDKRELCEGVIGNPLLASQGQQVKEFIGALYARLDQFPFEEKEDYTANNKNTLLHCIQQEILELQFQGGMAEVAGDAVNLQKQPVPAADTTNALRSVQIHSCHSPLREVEVLHDQLLALFTHDPTLKPRDVVVMIPQVAPYVPYIETVFGATAHAMPYHIADRSWLEEVPLLHSLDLLLGLPESRLPLTDILALLEVPAVHACFGLDRAGFEKLKTWLRDAGARWGLDASHRQQAGLPAYSEFSWEFAMNRLLAGYGMAASDNGTPLALAGDSLPVMPYDEIEGGGAALLDGFLQFWEKVKLYRLQLQETVTVDSWADRLMAMLDDFFVPQTDDEQLALREIRKQVGLLRKANQWYAEPVALAVVKAVLQPALQAPAHGGHPWREGIKFCSLMPMRGVPFRVVYMLGMNQSDYPKRSTQASFDQMRNHYQAGDRSRRVDDRWLFLEALLSARDVFHISYLGRDQRKNEERQPSVVVAELMDYLRHGYCLPGVDDPDGKQLLQALTIEHPLQPFSRMYFVDEANPQPGFSPKRFSFNKQAFAIASSKSGIVQPVAVGDVWPKSANSAIPVEVSLNSFVKFFTDPAKWFFGDRHKKVSLTIEDESVSDAEIFELASGLEEWALKDALRELAEQIEPVADPEQRMAAVMDAVETRWKAEGQWPLGSGGSALRQKIASELKISWLDARREFAGKPVTYTGSCELETTRGKLVLRGDLACLGDTLFFHTASKSSNKHEFRFAIQAAFAGLALSDKINNAVAVFWGDEPTTIQNPGNRDNVVFLQALAELYMQFREQGLPFEPGLSLAFKPDYLQDKNKWETAVAKCWRGDGYNSDGIASDMQTLAYYMVEQRLLDEAFMAVADTVTTVIKQWETSEKVTEVQP